MSISPAVWPGGTKNLRGGRNQPPPPTIIGLNNPTGTQSVFIQCNLPFSKVLVGEIYRPPNICPKLFIEEMSCVLDTISKTSSSIIITGDYNFDLLNIDVDINANIFFNLLSSYGFLPTISLATRMSDEKVSSLDNIYCNNIASAGRSGIIYDDLSDHYPIFLTIKIEKPQVRYDRTTTNSFNYRKLDDLKLQLQTELRDILHMNDPNIFCSQIINAFSSGLNKFSYLHTPNRKNTPIKPWITPGILTSINRKNELFLFKNNHASQSSASKYRNYRNILVSVIRESKKYIYKMNLKMLIQRRHGKYLMTFQKDLLRRKLCLIHLRLTII